MKKMKMLLLTAMLLAAALCPALCGAEQAPVVLMMPAATPAPIELTEPEPTPAWLNVIETELSLGRHDYVEEVGHIVHTQPMTYLTTHMAEISTQYDELCDVWGTVDYSASEYVEFELTTKVTAPDGTVTQTQQRAHPFKAGEDEHEHLHEEETVKAAFAGMIERNGMIDPGLYLYEMFIDGQLIGSHNFTILECDYSPAELDHESFLYTDPDCLIPLMEIPMGEEVRILSAQPSTIGYLGYAFYVEWNQQSGYVKCYDVMPKCDEWLLSAVESGKLDGVNVEYADIRIAFGEKYGYGVACMTRGQAEYCAQMEDVNILTGLSYTVNRPFIPQGLGKAVAYVRDANNPKGKAEKIELEDAGAKTAEDSAKMVFSRLKKKKLHGDFTVSIEIDGEEYANYSAGIWSGDPYVHGGYSASLDVGIYIRVILPDNTVFESTADRQIWSYFGENMYNSYDGMELEQVFEQMMQDGGVKTGVYKVEMFVENALAYVGEFEVLDADCVPAQVFEPTSLYESKNCKKAAKQMTGGTMVEMEVGESAAFEALSKYGDWTEEHLAVPVKHRDILGYVDCEYLKMLTDETLPEYIQKMLTVRERPDWITLSIAAPTTSSTYATGSATEEVMTSGMASLAADHKAYKIRTFVYYSLKEDRDAQFEITITRPDGVTFERTKSHMPNYNMEDKSLFSDYSICDMFKQMEKEKGILPGSYHYEIREVGSGLYIDGWFEILDVALAMGETREDAKLYASPNKSRVIARVPIYSDIFLYDDYRCEHTWYTAEYDDTSGSYIARVSFDGMMGYMEQRDYDVEADAGAELLERLGEETVAIDSLKLIYSEDENGKYIDKPLDWPLEYDQMSRMLGSYGDVSIRAEMNYTSAATEQLMLFEFMVQSPSGRQMATSQMYVYFDKPGRDSSENVLVDAGSIITLLERMNTQGKIEEGIYSYSVMMNGQVLARTEFEVGRQGGLSYYSTPWAEESIEEKAAPEASGVPYEPQETYDDFGAVPEAGEFGTARIREGSSVNVRQKSDADSRRVGLAKGGATYPCLGVADNGWLQIQLEDGTIGYVSGKMAFLIEE